MRESGETADGPGSKEKAQNSNLGEGRMNGLGEEVRVPEGVTAALRSGLRAKHPANDVSHVFSFSFPITDIHFYFPFYTCGDLTA